MRAASIRSRGMVSMYCLSRKTPVGVATYANSITLTPGTITIEVNRRERELLVHALTKAGADGLAEGEMDRRVARMEKPQ